MSYQLDSATAKFHARRSTSRRQSLRVIFFACFVLAVVALWSFLVAGLFFSGGSLSQFEQNLAHYMDTDPNGYTEQMKILEKRIDSLKNDVRSATAATAKTTAFPFSSTTPMSAAAAVASSDLDSSRRRSIPDETKNQTRRMETTSWNTNNFICRRHLILSTFRCTGNGADDDGCNLMRRLIEANTKGRITTMDPEHISFLTVPTDPKIVPQNQFGLPTLRGILVFAEAACPEAATYTFVNGDIFMGPDLIPTIEGVQKWISDRAAYLNDATITPTDFLIVAPRVETPWNHKWHYDSSVIPREVFMPAGTKMAQKRFNAWAQDTFIFSPGALRYFTQHLQPEIVIARTGFDNYLLDTAYAEPSIALVFCGESFFTIHQKDPNETAGSNSAWKLKTEIDKNWNRPFTYPIGRYNPSRFGSLDTTVWVTSQGGRHNPHPYSPGQEFFTGRPDKASDVTVKLRPDVKDTVLLHAKTDEHRRLHFKHWRQKHDRDVHLQIYLISYGNLTALKKLYTELEETTRAEMTAHARHRTGALPDRIDLTVRLVDLKFNNHTDFPRWLVPNQIQWRGPKHPKGFAFSDEIHETERWIREEIMGKARWEWGQVTTTPLDHPYIREPGLSVKKEGDLQKRYILNSEPGRDKGTFNNDFNRHMFAWRHAMNRTDFNTASPGLAAGRAKADIRELICEEGKSTFVPGWYRWLKAAWGESSEIDANQLLTRTKSTRFIGLVSLYARSRPTPASYGEKVNVTRNSNTVCRRDSSTTSTSKSSFLPTALRFTNKTIMYYDKSIASVPPPSHWPEVTGGAGNDGAGSIVNNNNDDDGCITSNDGDNDDILFIGVSPHAPLWMEFARANWAFPDYYEHYFSSVSAASASSTASASTAADKDKIKKEGHGRGRGGGFQNFVDYFIHDPHHKSVAIDVFIPFVHHQDKSKKALKAQEEDDDDDHAPSDAYAVLWRKAPTHANPTQDKLYDYPFLGRQVPVPATTSTLTANNADDTPHHHNTYNKTKLQLLVNQAKWSGTGTEEKVYLDYCTDPFPSWEGRGGNGGEGENGLVEAKEEDHHHDAAAATGQQRNKQQQQQQQTNKFLRLRDYKNCMPYNEKETGPFGSFGVHGERWELRVKTADKLAEDKARILAQRKSTYWNFEYYYQTSYVDILGDE